VFFVAAEQQDTKRTKKNTAKVHEVLCLLSEIPTGGMFLSLRFTTATPQSCNSKMIKQ